MEQTDFVKNLMQYGPLGIISAYFLYQDYLDRKSNREHLQKMTEAISGHETRICLLEEKIKGDK